MKRSEEPRVGAFAACPFCGERKRLTLVTKRIWRHIVNADEHGESEERRN